MKKLLLFGFISILFSCTNKPLVPIEKYQNQGFILVDVFSIPTAAIIKIKNKDTIMEIAVLKFDIKDMKFGDSLISKKPTYKSSTTNVDEQFHNKNQ